MSSIYGYINKNILKFNSDSYINDDNIAILIDDKYIKKEEIYKIKKLYNKIGDAFVNEIDDLYSIYLYDKKKNKLILIRDRIGLKQIYYHIDENNIYFGKDIMEIVDKYKIKKNINIESLSMYFRYDYINPPQTIFKNIYKLEHGHYLVWENNSVRIEKYWDEVEKYNENKKNKVRNFKIAKNELDNLLSEYISKNIDKKNFGIYLSGGIDSSLVAALCKKYSPKRINTFSIGFYENEKNEAKKAKRIAKHLKTNHHELYIDKNKAIETVKKIPSYYTEPFADSSEIPTIVINELAKKHNINIAFTGDGADQLFCGCRIYDKLQKYKKARRILNPLDLYFDNRITRRNLKLKYIYCNKKYKSQFDIINQDLRIQELFNDIGQKRYEYEDKIKTKNLQEKRMILDLGTFISNRVIKKMGTAANKNNIEIKSPFLTKTIIEYSFRIPHKYKYHKKIKKYILKEVLYKYVPKKLIEQKKRGFSIPTNKWIKSFLYDDLKRVSTKEFIEKQKIFKYEMICNLIRNISDRKYTQVIWNYYMFQIWYEKYMLDK